jgi:hypothetical protein
MVKGNSGNSWAIRGGDAQTGALRTLYSGARPSRGYNPMKKEGAIILGVGGDNSHTGQGTFFEGCMTSGFPTDATDAAVQANIVAAGYGSATTSIPDAGATSRMSVSIGYDPASATVRIGYALEHPARIRLRVVDLRGREIASLASEAASAGRHDALWKTGMTHSGMFAVVLEIEGRNAWRGNVLVGK